MALLRAGKRPCVESTATVIRPRHRMVRHPGRVTAQLRLHHQPPHAGGDLSVAVAHIERSLATSPEGERFRTRILDFVRSHPDALHRSCLEGHLTGSALVVDHVGERTLLMLHAKLGMWLQPGGHADGEGNLAAVALAEATEETGISRLSVVTPAIDCDVHTIPARPGEPEHLHLDVRFLVLAPEDAAPSGNHESRGLAWVRLDQVDAMATDESLRRLARIGFAIAPDVVPGLARREHRRRRSRTDADDGCQEVTDG